MEEILKNNLNPQTVDSGREKENDLSVRNNGTIGNDNEKHYKQLESLGSIRARLSRAKTKDRLFIGLLNLLGSIFLFLIIILAAYIIIKGVTSYFPGVMAGKSGGIGNQLFNTVYLVILSLIFSCLIGIPAGIYMALYAGQSKLVHFLRICIEALSSLPSIVIGLFGYLVFVLWTGMGWTLFGGALTVSILCIPLISTTTEDALRALPTDYLEGSLALGSTKWYAIRKVLLPAAFPRIMTGIILAAGRGFGEATALMYTAGMSTIINWDSMNVLGPTSPLNPFRPGETLALHIWTLRSEALASNSTDVANVSAAILVVVVLIFSLSARFMTVRIQKKQSGNK